MPLFMTAVSVALLAGMALLSAVESAVLLMPVGRVYRLVESHVRGAGSVDLLVERRHRLRSVSAFVAGLTTASAAAAGYGWFLVSALTRPAIPDLAVVALGLVGALLGVCVAFALGQALPRTLAVSNPERIALQGGSSALVLTDALWPLVRLLGAPWRWAVEVVAKESTLTPWAVTPEFRGSAGEEGEREEAEEALLEAVSDFAEKITREVMVPRTDVASLPDTANAKEAMALIHKTGFSRLPVYRESIDDVQGVLYAKDLLVALGREDTPDIRKIARKPFFVPETKPLEELLLEMRKKTHIAIVTDEYGGTSGIVTLEDLLEEIVGEISDEYDREEQLLVELGDGRYRLDARLPVDDFNEVFGTDLDTDADSIGGVFTEMAGRIPEVGESLDLEGLRFTVSERQGTRIRQLLIEPVDAQEGEDRA